MGQVVGIEGHGTGNPRKALQKKLISKNSLLCDCQAPGGSHLRNFTATSPLRHRLIQLLAITQFAGLSQSDSQLYWSPSPGFRDPLGTGRRTRRVERTLWMI
ncbi:unnamed protein product [Tuber aestivum]|uniref:Uncharacterized protein n=1 Tax=Tuber aestivum TaxID=59557 RepID=A0A292Q6Q0_9PEZI|nr:unnamed protein product [Tuber aestivum]